MVVMLASNDRPVINKIKFASWSLNSRLPQWRWCAYHIAEIITMEKHEQLRRPTHLQIPAINKTDDHDYNRLVVTWIASWIFQCISIVPVMLRALVICHDMSIFCACSFIMIQTHHFDWLSEWIDLNSSLLPAQWRNANSWPPAVLCLSDVVHPLCSSIHRLSFCFWHIWSPRLISTKICATQRNLYCWEVLMNLKLNIEATLFQLLESAMALKWFLTQNFFPSADNRYSYPHMLHFICIIEHRKLILG